MGEIEFDNDQMMLTYTRSVYFKTSLLRQLQVPADLIAEWAHLPANVHREESALKETPLRWTSLRPGEGMEHQGMEGESRWICQSCCRPWWIWSSGRPCRYRRRLESLQFRRGRKSARRQWKKSQRLQLQLLRSGKLTWLLRCPHLKIMLTFYTIHV